MCHRPPDRIIPLPGRTIPLPGPIIRCHRPPDHIILHQAPSILLPVRTILHRDPSIPDLDRIIVDCCERHETLNSKGGRF